MAVNPIIKLRVGGDPLTNADIDTNFTGLKTAIVSVGDQADSISTQLSTHISTQNGINASVDSILDSHQSSIDNLNSTLGTTLTDYIKKDGSIPFTGSVDLGNNLINNLLDPVANKDAANKEYVDQSLLPFLKVDGSIPLSGNLNVANNKIINVDAPTSDGDATNKLYVDTSVLNINLTAYVKRDGSTSLTDNLDFSGFTGINIHTPQLAGDIANKQYVDDRVSCVNELELTLNDSDIYSADLIPATYADEIDNSGLLDNIVYSSNVDSDNITFPNKAYIANVRFADVYANFPNSVVDLKLVNKSTGKLIIDVYLNDGITKICRLLPKSQARLQWVDDTVSPVWLVTKSSNLEEVENARPSNNFLKAVIGINGDGTFKSNYSWIGLDQSGSPALEFTVTHTPASGIYDITWENNNSFSSNVLYSPVVIPTLMLTNLDTDDYKIYLKDVTSGGCSIHIKDSAGYIDKDFSLMIGGHNTVDGNNFGNPFLV